MKKIVLLQHYFNEIGGIETFIINFCKTFYKDYDITLVCRRIGEINKSILSKYINVVTNPMKTIECDICIITSVEVDKPFFDLIKYKEIYHMIHSDWVKIQPFWKLKYKNYDKNTKYIAVSETARESFKEISGQDSIVIPNIVVKSDERILKLCSATRLTNEKGFSRMVRFEKILNEHNIPHIWDIYTNSLETMPIGSMCIKKSRQQISSLFKMYDYVVQLSDTESFCYTMYESLLEGVPVLVTPFPNALKEIKEGVNGYIIPFDMKNIDVDKIYNNIPKDFEFTCKDTIKLWKEVLK